MNHQQKLLFAYDGSHLGRCDNQELQDDQCDFVKDHHKATWYNETESDWLRETIPNKFFSKNPGFFSTLNAVQHFNMVKPYGDFLNRGHFKIDFSTFFFFSWLSILDIYNFNSTYFLKWIEDLLKLMAMLDISVKS